MIDRAGIAGRLRGLFAGQEYGDVGDLARHLGVEELSLRMSIDEISPHPTVEVLVAAIRVYGLDPSWLLTGVYDSGTHRSVMEGEADLAATVRGFLLDRPPRISDPTQGPFRFHDPN